jgi:hypothetical protein
MLFVVYSKDDEQYFIAPIKWIQDLKFERIVNYILNSSLQYRCFCGSDAEAYGVEGTPNENYMPNFSSTDETKFYIVSLVKFFGNCDNIIFCLNYLKY